jgi:hypothetical protein
MHKWNFFRLLWSCGVQTVTGSVVIATPLFLQIEGRFTYYLPSNCLIFTPSQYFAGYNYYFIIFQQISWSTTSFWTIGVRYEQGLIFLFNDSDYLLVLLKHTIVTIWTYVRKVITWLVTVGRNRLPSWFPVILTWKAPHVVPHNSIFLTAPKFAQGTTASQNYQRTTKTPTFYFR